MISEAFALILWGIFLGLGLGLGTGMGAVMVKLRVVRMCRIGTSKYEVQFNSAQGISLSRNLNPAKITTP